MMKAVVQRVTRAAVRVEGQTLGAIESGLLVLLGIGKTDTSATADWLIGKGFNASAIIAWAGQEAPNTADNAQPRMWFSVGYGW